MKTLILCIATCASVACSAQQSVRSHNALPAAPATSIAQADTGAVATDASVTTTAALEPDAAATPEPDGPWTTGPVTGAGPFTLSWYVDPGAGSSHARLILIDGKRPVRAYYIGGANACIPSTYERLAGPRTRDVIFAEACVPDGQVTTGPGQVMRVIQRGNLLIVQEGESHNHRVARWTDRYTQELPVGATVTVKTSGEPSYEEIDAWVHSEPGQGEPQG